MADVRGLGAARPTTPDGVPLASYGSRVGAYLLDGMIMSMLQLIFSWPFLGLFVEWYLSQLRQIAQNQGGDIAGLQAGILAQMWPILLIG